MEGLALYRSADFHRNKSLERLSSQFDIKSMIRYSNIQSFCKRIAFVRTSVRTASKGSSSSRWLRRQQTDLYVKKALQENYRCRSAFKLIELDDKFHFLRPGKVVIDCGASPGSWTQVAVKRVVSAKPGHDSKNGLVIAVDLLDIEDIPDASILSRCDFTNVATQSKIQSLLPTAGADVIMSDMAPNASGNHAMNHEAILIMASILTKDFKEDSITLLGEKNLCESAFGFGKAVMKSGGVFLCKLWDGYGTQDFVKMLQKNFELVKECKPHASRKESAEIYIYAEGFKKS